MNLQFIEFKEPVLANYLFLRLFYSYASPLHMGEIGAVE
ncbi:hypothetical protein RintRC_7440 [Richelia intracellularis]|nr:hypothetical protein RintRC_7440 [Richelia intracellularis]